MKSYSALSSPVIAVSVAHLYGDEQVDATNGGANTVKMAFAAGNANPTVWYTAEWQTVTPPALAAPGTPTTYQAWCQIGPDGLTGQLAVGEYTAWVKVTDTSGLYPGAAETIIGPAATFRVF